jgi:uncharacterized LabA/DUF88 family protein
MGITDEKAAYYVDGRNLASYAQRFAPQGERDVSVDPGTIVKGIADATRGLEMHSISYFSGIPAPDRPAFRAREVFKLNALADRGVMTHANDLVLGDDGLYHEAGVDLHMGGKMIEDFLYHGVRKFVLLSNDQDFEPFVERLRLLSRQTHQPVKIYNAICEGFRPIATTIPIVIPDRTIEHALFDWKPLLKGALENFEQDRARAMDARRHEKPIAPARATSLPASGVAIIADLQSMGKIARGPSLRRPHLDANVSELVDLLAKQRGWGVVAKNAYSCIHDRTVSLRESLLVSSMLDRLSALRWRTKQFPYQYSLDRAGGPQSKHDPGHRHSSPTRVPREKKIHATMLTDAISMAQHRAVDTIVILSDDPNLWPIVPLVKKIGRSHGKADLRVIHAKMNEQTRTYDGAEHVLVPRSLYLASIDTVDRMKLAQQAERDALYRDIGIINEELAKQMRRDPEFLVKPEQAIGRFVFSSAHWSALQQSDGVVALYRTRDLPIPLVHDQKYRLSNHGQSVDVLERDNRSDDRQNERYR